MTPAPTRSTSFLRRLPLLAAATATLLLGNTAYADEVRLHDGRVLVGKVVKKNGGLEITTRDGVVVVAENEVDQVVADETLRQRLHEHASRADDTTFAHLQLAMQARASGLEPEMWRYLDRAIEKRDAASKAGEAGGDGLQRRLADFLGQLEAEMLPRRLRTAASKVRVHQLLDGMHATTSKGRAAAIEELLVREAGADQDLRNEARRNTNPRQRIAALSALQRRQLAGNDRFVLRTAVLDGTEQVREAAVALSRPTVDADDIDYMASGLSHSNPKVRVRTADALGDLGRAEAVKLLVLAGPHAGVGLAGGANEGVRAHIAIVQQQAYIRDYDVEVAQAAFIADPKVDVLQSGAVLDVTVAGVIEIRTIIRVYRQALKRLTQSDPGEDPRNWGAWLASVQPPATAPATTTPR